MKCCFASVVNSDYLPGFKVLARSLLEHNPAMDFDFVVIHEQLTSREQAEIRRLLPKARFHRVASHEYVNASENLSRTQPRLREAFYKFEAFAITDYDRVILLDTDMIVLGDVSLLAEIDADLAGREAVNCPGISTGLLVISGPFLDSTIKRSLIEGIDRYVGHLADQDVFSAMYASRTTPLPEAYNCVRARVGPHALPLEEVRILHYAGPNPWDVPDPGPLDQIWLDYHRKHFGPLPKDRWGARALRRGRRILSDPRGAWIRGAQLLGLAGPPAAKADKPAVKTSN